MSTKDRGAERRERRRLASRVAARPAVLLADQARRLLAVGEELANALALESQSPSPIFCPGPVWEPDAWDEPHGFWHRVATCSETAASLIERRRIDVEAVRLLYDALVRIRAEWEATDVADFIGDQRGDHAAAIARWCSAVADRFERAVAELRELVASSFNAPATDGAPPRRRG